MVRTKYVDSDLTPRMKKLWWYQYGGKFKAQVDALVDLQFAPSMTKRVVGAFQSLKSIMRRL
jgi:hypothetical protein